jgi:ribosomal protein L30/L7E
LSRVADLQDIVDDLETEIRRPISVEDRRWRLLAHSAQPDEADPVRQRSILTRETPPDVTAWLEGLGLQRARELVDVPENEALGMKRRGCLPIRHGDVLLGFLWVIVGDAPLSDDERAALARGGAEVAENLWRRVSEADESRRRSESLLRAVLAGEDEAGKLAAALRWLPTGSFAVAVCEGATDVPERLRRRRGAADFAWTQDETRFVLIARDPDRLPEALASLGASGGVSAGFADLARTRVAARQAELAALCVKAQHGLGPVAAFDELGSWALIADLWDAADRPFPPVQILSLTTHRRGDQLLEALEGLLDAGGDVAEAARSLSMHRATLYRRVDRIEHLTGLDLTRGDDRLLAHLGLRIHRLRSTL